MQFVDTNDNIVEENLKSLREENDVLRVRLDGLEGERKEHEFLYTHAAR